MLINATSDFGGFDAMMYLDPDALHLIPYMAALVKYFQGVSRAFPDSEHGSIGN